MHLVSRLISVLVALPVLALAGGATEAPSPTYTPRSFYAFEPGDRYIGQGDHRLNGEVVWKRLESLRSIETEDQMNTDLEQGTIDSPLDFEPHEDDWTR